MREELERAWAALDQLPDCVLEQLDTKFWTRQASQLSMATAGKVDAASRAAAADPLPHSAPTAADGTAAEAWHSPSLLWGSICCLLAKANNCKPGLNTRPPSPLFIDTPLKQLCCCPLIPKLFEACRHHA